MRSLVRFLDEELPFIDEPTLPVHEDPYKPITKTGKRLVGELPEEKIPIAWWPRKQRYAERLSPGTKFADIIGEIDPAKLAGGASMSAEEALHFGLIPRMHRGIFAMNEIPELDELVQVGLFNILEERDVQIRGYPIQFDIDVLILFSANPATFNRSGKVIPQLKDRIGSLIHTHYPLDRAVGIEIMEQEAGIELGGEFPVLVPPFMKEIIEQMSMCARRVEIRRSPIRRQCPLQHRQLPDHGRQCPATRRAPGGTTSGAAHQRSWPSLLVVARQTGAGHDGQPADVRTASAGVHSGGGDQNGVRGVC